DGHQQVGQVVAQDRAEAGQYALRAPGQLPCLGAGVVTGGGQGVLWFRHGKRSPRGEGTSACNQADRNELTDRPSLARSWDGQRRPVAWRWRCFSSNGPGKEEDVRQTAVIFARAGPLVLNCPIAPSARRHGAPPVGTARLWRTPAPCRNPFPFRP